MSIIYLAHFDGNEGETAITDEFGYAVICYKNAKLTQTGQTFGTACAVSDGNGSRLLSFAFDSTQDPDNWTIRFRFTPTEFIAIAPLLRLSCADGYHVWLIISQSGWLHITDTDGIDTYNNGVQLAADTQYAFSIECLNNQLYLYINSNRIYNGIPIRSGIINNLSYFWLFGENDNDSCKGRIDELMIDAGVARANGEPSYAVETTSYDLSDVLDSMGINIIVSEDIEIHLNIDEPIDISQALPPTYEEDEVNTLTLNVTDQYSSYLGHENVDVLQIGYQISSVYSIEPYVKPNWISREYVCRMGNLELPIASISATLSASGSSYVSLSIPANNDTLNGILERTNEKIIITRRHIYSDHSTLEREFIRVNYDTVNSSRGANNHSIVLVGRSYLPVQQSKPVTASKISYINYQNGKRTIRLPVDDSINLGDDLTYENDSFIVGKITYYIETSQEFMEVSEYIADGTDNNGIGSNIRETEWQKYLVVETNPNYTLWQEQGYLYNGIANNPADSTNYQYNLWYDGDGLLWYAPNFPVFEEDGTTQASINL